MRVRLVYRWEETGSRLEHCNFEIYTWEKCSGLAKRNVAGPATIRRKAELDGETAPKG